MEEAAVWITSLWSFVELCGAAGCPLGAQRQIGGGVSQRLPISLCGYGQPGAVLRLLQSGPAAPGPELPDTPRGVFWNLRRDVHDLLRGTEFHLIFRSKLS